MAIPSPELAQALWSDPRFLEAVRDVVRGYRWAWRRVGGNRWVVERVSVEPLWTGWDWGVPRGATGAAGPGKSISTVRMPRPGSE